MDKYEKYKRVPMFNMLVHSLMQSIDSGMVTKEEIIEALELAQEIRLERKRYDEESRSFFEALIADATGKTKTEVAHD